MVASIESVELRRYVLKPGRFTDLLAIFEREFLEAQDACGMSVVGHYRDLDDPDAFVWLRGFERFENRGAALEAFYLHAEAWSANKAAANDTMLDSDNVLLLRPARANSGFDLKDLLRPAPTERRASDSFVAIAVVSLDRPADDAYIAGFETQVLPEIRAISRPVAYFVTEERPNEFPRLPVREGAWSFVVCAVCEYLEDVETFGRAFGGRAEILRLEPAARTLLR